jgi:tRNA dimethylallyltransferase
MTTHPLIFVVGPTGVGKSGWALEMAQHTNGVILNCDSVQSYQGLDIGTAKPTVEEQKVAPHFLFDVMKPGEVLTAGDYRRMALEVLEQELPSRPVYAVGGSGFYIQALEKGMFEIDKVEPAKESALRARLDQQTLKDWYEELKELDPETAEDLNPNDSYRIQRALMIVLGLGKRLSDLKKQFKPKTLPYPLIKVGLKMEREHLRTRIEARTRTMLEHGLIREVEGLLKKGLKDWPILQSVGYRQVMMVLQGELAESNLLEEITLRTFQLSKRQMTWFQRDKEIRWFDTKDAHAAKEWLLGELDSRG